MGSDAPRSRHRYPGNRAAVEQQFTYATQFAREGPAAETVTSRVARGQGNGVSDGFDGWSQRFRKSSAGCLMPWRSVRTCGLASK